jgi:hypothetical protein
MFVRFNGAGALIGQVGIADHVVDAAAQADDSGPVRGR